MTEAKPAPLAPEDVGKDADWGTFRDCLKLSCRPQTKEQKATCKAKDGDYDELERTCKITVAYSTSLRTLLNPR